MGKGCCGEKDMALVLGLSGLVLECGLKAMLDYSDLRLYHYWKGDTLDALIFWGFNASE